MRVATLLSELAQAYPNGISFDPMTLRLLRQKVSVDEWQIENLKSEMFQLENGLWFSCEMILDDESRSMFERQATVWLEEQGCFSVKRLFEKFYNIFQLINRPEDCAVLLRHLNFTVREWRTGGDFCCLPSLNLDESLAAISEMIIEWLDEANGTLSLNEIEQKLTHLTKEALESIRAQLLSEVFVSEIGGIPCWCNTETIPLPEDFSAKVTAAIDTLVILGKRVSAANLEFALDLFYRTQIRLEYALQDNTTFMRVCTKHYQGENNIKKKRSVVKSLSESGKRTRSPNTRFSNLNVPIGAELTFVKDSNITCKVIDDTNQVQYGGKAWAISTLAIYLLGGSSVNGFHYFDYRGETLWERRLRLQQQANRKDKR